jgi:hypothetical protein
MLTLTIEREELYNPEDETFVFIGPMEVKLEHSLLSISKWESIWERPFLPNVFTPEKTAAQLRSYTECMIIGRVPPPYVLHLICNRYDKEIADYISKKHTATTIQRAPGGKKQPLTRIITSEVIYYQMITFGIPLECEKWHFNRLLALLEVFIVKNSNKKLSPSEAAAQRRAINQQRLAAAKKGR